MKVKLIKLRSDHDDSEINSLTIGSVYDVLGIECDSYRIINEKDHEPYLYQPDCFEIIDDSIPDFWVTEYGEDGERYCYPACWNKVGFFEDYFGNVREVRNKFWQEYKEYFGTSAANEAAGK